MGKLHVDGRIAMFAGMRNARLHDGFLSNVSTASRNMPLCSRSN
jgi:hypothetical protein